MQVPEKRFFSGERTSLHKRENGVRTNDSESDAAKGVRPCVWTVWDIGLDVRVRKAHTGNTLFHRLQRAAMVFLYSKRVRR